MSTNRHRPNRPAARHTPAGRPGAAPHRPTPPPKAEPEAYDEAFDDEPYEDDLDEQTAAATAQELEASGHYVPADLCGEELRVIPPGAWRQSWQRHLSAGRFDAFAENVIHPDDLEVYFDLDPTNDEFGDFVAAAAERAGESLGKSRGPGRSSRRTPRR